MSKYDLVIYHNNCPDGFCCAYLAKRCFPEAQLLPMNYGDPIDQKTVLGRRVLIADFSFPRTTLLNIYGWAQHLKVLDHHKTAAEDLADLPFAEFDLNRSGAKMVFDHLVTQYRDLIEDCRKLVEYVQDRDLWRFRLLETKHFTAVQRSLRYNIEDWDQLVEVCRDSKFLQREGNPILRMFDRMVEDAVARARVVNLDDTPVPAVNSTVLFSEIAGALAERAEYKIGACWFQRSDGMFQWSLRSRDGVDVTPMARRFGGGGHPTAAGFAVNPEDHMRILVPFIDDAE